MKKNINVNTHNQKTFTYNNKIVYTPIILQVLRAYLEKKDILKLTFGL